MTPEKLEELNVQLDRDKLDLEKSKLLLEERKFEAEAEKRDQEGRKLEAETEKTNLEASDLKKAFWQRSIWVSPLLQGLAIIIAIVGSIFSLSLNQQMFDLKLAGQKAQTERDQAQKETAKARMEAAEARNQQQVAEGRIEDARRALDRTKSEITSLEEQEDEEAIQPLKAILQNPSSLSKVAVFEERNADSNTWVPSDDIDRMASLLRPDDRKYAVRRDYLNSVAKSKREPVLQRLMAAKALLAASIDFPDHNSALAAGSQTILRAQLIHVALSSILEGDGSATNRGFDVLRAELGYPEASIAFCNEYTAQYAQYDLTGILSKKVLSFAYAAIPPVPECASVLWDTVDPKLDPVPDGIFAFDDPYSRLPKEIVLARYYKKIVPSTGVGIGQVILDSNGTTAMWKAERKVWPFDSLSSYFDRLIISKEAFADSGVLAYVDESRIDRTNDSPLAASRYFKDPNAPPGKLEGNPHWAESIRDWYDKNQELISALKEPGLQRLRTCRLIVFAALREDAYIGPQDLAKYCSAFKK